MSYLGLTKIRLLALPTDELKAAHAELDDYVERLYAGGGNRNWATQHVGIYKARRTSVERELALRG